MDLVMCMHSVGGSWEGLIPYGVLMMHAWWIPSSCGEVRRRSIREGDGWTIVANFHLD